MPTMARYSTRLGKASRTSTILEVVEDVGAERLVVQRNDGYWGDPAELGRPEEP